MANLAIRGHKTRGKEVIEILEMLGGKNIHNSWGVFENRIYTIDEKTGEIIDVSEIHYSDYNLFTFEEFLEKYPYKIGDKVVYTKYGDNCDEYPVTIESMKWTGTTIEYTFDDYVTCLAKDLKMWTGKLNVVISGIYLNSYDYADEVELNLGNYEIEVRDGRTYAVNKKSKYPKTYDECYDEYNTELHFIYVDKDERDLYESFIQLIRCRNAYWKIAGEQMGLCKPCEPDWYSTDRKYNIYNYRGVIKYDYFTVVDRCLLVFPTVEMRDAFYKNFKDLIEQCKELL